MSQQDNTFSERPKDTNTPFVNPQEQEGKKPSEGTLIYWEGREEGRKDTIRKMAARLYNNGTNIEQIEKCTGIGAAEIIRRAEMLKEEMQRKK